MKCGLFCRVHCSRNTVGDVDHLNQRLLDGWVRFDQDIIKFMLQ